jgi:Fibronectin type-III domain
VRRKVTNVGGSAATYDAAVTGMTGLNVTVTPASLSLAAGETKSFTVTFTRTTATVAAYTGGQLTWSDGTHRVRSPMVVRPVALSVPTTVSGTGAPINYDVRFGYTGTFTATPRGLVPSVRSNGTVTDDPDDTFTVGGPGTATFPVTIPAGTTYARFSLFDANVSPASDLDLYVTRNTDNAVVAASGGATSAEEANLLKPAAGDYTVHVHGFAVNGTATFTLFNWLLGSTSAGNMTVNAPATATTGTTGVINLTFSGLTAAEKYLGSVAYSGVSGLPNPTIVRVDTS